MKISLHAEFDSPEEYSAFIDMLVARPVAVRAFEAPRIEPKGDGEIVTYKDTVAIVGGQEPGEKQPGEDPRKPPEPAPTKPTEPEKEPAATQAAPPEEKKRRGRRTKAEMQAAATAQAGAHPAAAAAPAVAAARPAEAIIVTREDLASSFKAYVDRYGVPMGYNDVSKLLQTNFGEGVRKMSDVTDDNLAHANAIVKAAIVENPFNRKVANA